MRIAICRYVIPRIIPDVSEALHHFFNMDLDPHVEKEVQQECPNAPMPQCSNAPIHPPVPNASMPQFPPCRMANAQMLNAAKPEWSMP